MKPVLYLLAINYFLFALPLAAQVDSIPQSRVRSLREVRVSAHRPLSQIGVQQSHLDTILLRDNISQSLSDLLSFGSSLYVKEQGRGSLSTISFRGTAPSHTQVLWNGISLNSPMLGFSDLSRIPSHFVDEASLLHGSSSISKVGGGLGGAVILGTNSEQLPTGHSLLFSQGAGSYDTYDSFLKYSYRGAKWGSTTRLSYAVSKNDFEYLNKNKWELKYDDTGALTELKHPWERNSNGQFKDMHILQELYLQPNDIDKFSLSFWGLSLYRQLPFLDVQYGDSHHLINEQKEQTLRGIMSWQKQLSSLQMTTQFGITSTKQAYDNGYQANEYVEPNFLTQSRTRYTTLLASERILWMPSSKWQVEGELKVAHQMAKSEDMQMYQLDGSLGKKLEAKRLELSAYLSARWQPIPRLGVSPALRWEQFGMRSSPLIPALFLDYLITPWGNLTLKTSVSKNYRQPTLNDLYYLPGGNPDLKPEEGMTYDIGLDFSFYGSDTWAIEGGANWFDSYISDWILWLPYSGSRSIWTPRNMHKVHAYGIESHIKGVWQPTSKWTLNLSANFSWTPSINLGPAFNADDLSVGKQLVYIPLYSASAVAYIKYHLWTLTYKWAHYSKRFTMSSNEPTPSGVVAPYFMSDITLGREFVTKWTDLELKLTVKNLFNHRYQTVMGYPMPGTNYQILLTLRPKILN